MENQTQTYTIFCNQCQLIITDSGFELSPKDILPLTDSSNFVEIFTRYQKKRFPQTVWLLTDEPNKTFEKMCLDIDCIYAAGGLVVNEKKELLMIKRFGIWDLPKGKIEMDEAIEVAAVREVQEECGLKEVKSIQLIDSFSHTFFQKGTLNLKRTFWYLMESNSNEVLIPQIEEDITEVRWVKESELESLVKNNTYHSIWWLINQNRSLIFLN